ncbi:MAG: hypothetical protein WBA42_22605 [Mesorhizobium sp.]
MVTIKSALPQTALVGESWPLPLGRIKEASSLALLIEKEARVTMSDRRYRAIWLSCDERDIDILGQRRLPHGFHVTTLRMPEDVAVATHDMWCTSRCGKRQRAEKPGGVLPTRCLRAA